ncbi:VanW family protein [Amycolatopsis nigrescens]|uniref:VanW family protein n=1 Tax=Amycolatopsis nigrescens TaxID=381445 RepID=UPI0004759E16|nr:VanW family protein [Amycolatopsis nigrescens]
MPQGPVWPESHSEQTDVLPAISDRPAPQQDPAPGRRRSLRRAGIIGGAVVGVLAVLYGVDLLVTQGDVPRGVTVAGVDVGGLDHTAAGQHLREQIEPRLTQPVQVKAGDVEQSLDPKQAGLDLDWAATLDQAGSQPLNPFTRIASFFSSREVGVVTATAQDKLSTAIEALRAKVDRDPIEGTVRFENTKPVPVEPKPGQKLEPVGATQVVLSDWASGKPLDLPVDLTPVRTAPGAVQAALEQFARPAVSGPVTVKGEGKDAKLEPKAIAAALTFEPGDGGVLNPKLDQGKIVEAVGPQLKSTEKEGKDAEIVFHGGSPAVEPSEDGKKVNWEPSLAPLAEVLKRTGDRQLVAQYTTSPAKVTTEQANQLGIKEVIGEFSTGGFAADSGTNIKVVAQKVDGAIVKPGDTFSLNGFTGPRGTAQGYVEAGVISDGAPGREVGGGISQFATTLFNASYFAGMKDAGHKEHSYYISRYPAAREATVFQSHGGASVIDLKFTNDSETGVAVQTIWTPSQITVKLWGTKKYNVESVPGARTNFTEPQTKPGPAENCHAGNGAQGFTATDTRVLRDAASNREVRREPRTVRYNPQPKIVCEAP